MAEGGTIWVYGLLGDVGPVNVFPLILKSASLRGWVLYELTQDKDERHIQKGYQYILDGFEAGQFRQRVAHRFALNEVRAAHEELQKASHIGKIVLVP